MAGKRRPLIKDNMQNNRSWSSGITMTYFTNFGPPTRTPLFRTFYVQWREEKLPEWKPLHLMGVDQIADAHLLPWFGEQVVAEITRENVLAFRAHLAKLPGTKGKRMSASRINKVFLILNQILSEAALRYRFENPMKDVRKLKQPRPEIEVFTLEEVRKICDTVDEHYRDYVLCRFFTGMRTGEIDGLKWSRVDFTREVIEVRETFSAGVTSDGAKTLGSVRDIPMLPLVKKVLVARHSASRPKRGDYVFTSQLGKPISAKNFTNRVFYPALDRLGIARKAPYCTRHTAATLLLASGENPEWVAKFLGHSDTTMLFTRYSKYVPNLTRQDGSAASAFLEERWTIAEHSDSYQSQEGEE